MLRIERWEEIQSTARRGGGKDIPQRLKPNSLLSIYVRAEARCGEVARTLQDLKTLRENLTPREMSFPQAARVRVRLPEAGVDVALARPPTADRIQGAAF